MQFPEPLGADDESDWLAGITIKRPKEFDRKLPGTFYTKSTRGVLVIGHDRGGLAVDDVATFAKELGWPIVAEDPLSFPDALSHASIFLTCLLYTSPSPRDRSVSRMPSSA